MLRVGRSDIPTHITYVAFKHLGQTRVGILEDEKEEEEEEEEERD